jgi:hypothetical protein
MALLPRLAGEKRAEEDRADQHAEIGAGDPAVVARLVISCACRDAPMVHESEFALAARHVARGRQIVARQRERIARLKQLGCSTLHHERMLCSFLDTLQIFEEHEHELLGRRSKVPVHADGLSAIVAAQSPSSTNDPKHWRDRADEVRLLAEDMQDPTTKATMQRLARDYDHLAERAEQRTKGPPRPK